MVRYLSNRAKITPPGALSSDRYQYLGLNQVEPNLGNPAVPGPTIPIGSQYQLITVLENPGERYWIPIGGGLIPGSISIYEEGILTPSGGFSSITQLNFKGNSILAQGYLNPDNSPGIAATITVSPPGNNGSVLFKELNDFATSPNLVFNSSVGILTVGNGLNVGSGGSIFTAKSNGFVGIGTTNPTQELHVQGDLRLTGTIYDYNNEPGTNSQILVKNNFGGLTWINQGTVRSGAGGTYTNIQFHNNIGLVDGASNFVFDDINSRIGIGSTQPKVLLDVLGISSFKGGTTIDNLRVTGVSTIATLAVTGTTTTRNLQVTGITTIGFVTGTDAYFTGIVTASKFVGATDFTDLYVSGFSTFKKKVNIDDNLGISGLTTTQNLQVYQSTILNNLRVTGISTFESQVNINNLSVTGIGTFDNIKLDTNTISTLTGNLILNSSAGITQINDAIYVNDTTSSTDKDTGSIITEGGVGIEENLNVGGVVRLATSGGITTTGGDLYVKGNLYVINDIFYDELFARNGYFTGIVSTKDFNATGISTLARLGVSGLTTTKDLNVTGFSTFTGYIDANGGAYIDNIQIGITNDNTIDTNTGNLILNSASGTTIVSSNLSVTGIATFDNNVYFGNNTTDTVSFTSRINTAVLPSTDGTLNLGGINNKWNNVYANNFVGAITGNADTATYAVNAGVATYANNAGVATYATSAGVATYANNAGVATYSIRAGLTTNLVGGTASQIPYQFSSGITSFIPNGTSGYILQSNGTAAPSWVDPALGFNVATANYAIIAGVATYAVNAGVATYANNAGVATYANNAGVATYANNAGVATYASNAGVSTNLKGGSASQIPYQFSSGITSFIPNGTSGYILQSNGTAAPSWTNPALGFNVASANYAISAGVATYANNAGVATYANNAGVATYANNAGVATYAVNAGVATYATSAGLATNLVGGSASQIPYQFSSGITSFIPNGTSGYILQSNGTAAPSWTNPALGFNVASATYAVNAGVATYAVNAGVATYANNAGVATYANNAGVATYAVNAGVATYADNAGVSTNLKGGSASQIPYQFSSGITSFIPNGTSGYILQSNGTAAPSWTNPSLGFNVASANYANNSGVATYATSAGIATYANSSGIATYTTSAGVATYSTRAGLATNLVGGTASQIPYQFSSGITSFIPNGTSGYILQSNGTAAPSWVDPALGFNVASATYAVNAGVATYANNAGVATYANNAGVATYSTRAGLATNLVGGSASQIPYQFSSGITSFIPNGTSGYILQSNGTAAPSWADPSLGFNVASANYAISAGVATYATSAGVATYSTRAGLATDVEINGTNQLLYQVSNNNTGLIGAGTTGYLLKSNGGSSAPTWIDPSLGFNVDTANYAIIAGVATYANNVGVATYAVNAGVASYATRAGLATNLVGGSASQIPYQFSSGITSFIPNGTSGYILQSNGTAAPSWVDPALGFNVSSANYAISAGIATYATSAGVATYASNAGVSTNLKGGSASQIPYQFSSGITSFIPNGTSGYILQSNGTAAPSWTNPALGFNVASATYAVNAGVATYANNAGVATYSTRAGLATDVEINGTNQLLYQVSNNNTDVIPNGSTTGQLLQYNAGAAPSWVSATGLSVSRANYADSAGISTDIKGGTSGAILYQLGTDDTTFLPISSSGSILQSDGTKPVWTPATNIVTSYASSVAVAQDTGINDRYISLVDVTAGLTTIRTDTDLIYNSSNNLLTVQNIKPQSIQDFSGATGSTNNVLTANGAGGGWSWKPITNIGAIGGITIQEESVVVGNQLGITTVNFIGNIVTATNPTPGTVNVTINSASEFASGTTLIFYQANAPTGWTKVTTHNNKSLRVVSGTGGGSGGSLGFTNAFTVRGVPLVDHAHAVYDVGHAHNYEVAVYGANAGGSASPRATSNALSATSINGTGIGIYPASATQATGNTMDFSVQYIDVILCSKD